MGLKEIWQYLENFSSNILNSLLSVEEPISSFFQNFWGKLPEWGLIILSTIIGAIVAIKVDRIFRDKKRLHGTKLIKVALSETIGTAGGIFLIGLMIGVAVLVGISLIKTGMTYSPTITLAVLVTLLFWWRYKKKKAAKAISTRLQEGKRKKKSQSKK